jgi:hypothetical protein
MKKYQINFNAHWVSFWQILLIAAICAVMPFVGIGLRPDADPATFFWVALSCFLLQLVPLVCLHINYYSVNRADELEYDEAHQLFSFTHSGNTVQFSVADISQVIQFRSYALHNDNLQMLSWDTYNHVYIHLKNGTRLVLTSLLLRGEIKIPVESSRLETRLSLFRWAKGPSLSFSTTPQFPQAPQPTLPF